jgi:Domain of unknown function (DUF5666)
MVHLAATGSASRTTIGGTHEMTEQERQLRRADRWRLGAILALFLLGAVPVVVAFAASPDPSATDGASPAATVAPAATSAPAAALDTTAPSTESKGDGTTGRFGPLGAFGALRGGFGGFGGAITITAIDGSTLSLKTDDGWTRTITVTPDTKITKAGQTLAIGDLAVGDHIRFAQKKNADGTYTVTAIAVPTAQTAGEVTAVSGNTLTIKRRNGDTQTVTVTGSTIYKVGAAAGDKSDVKVGSKIEASGDASGTSFTALRVVVQPTLVAGEVTAKTSTTITLKRRDGTTITIHVSADTKYGIRGSKTASLADIAVGDTAWAAGITRNDGSLDATAVAKGFGFGRGKGDHRGAAPKPAATPAPSTGQG